MPAPTLLIPTDAAWTTALAARTALTGDAYWKLEIDEGAGYVDRTSLLDNNQLSIESRGSVFGGSTAGSASWVFRNLPKVFEEGDLANAPVKISAKIGAAGYIQVFAGYVDPAGCQRDRRSNRFDTIAVWASDPAKYRGLQRKTSSTAYLSYKICDTGTPAASLLHALAGQMGLAAGDLDTRDILLTKDYVGTDASGTAWAELQDMAKQHGAFLGFRYDGKLRFMVWTAAEWNAAATEYTFDSTNVHSFKANGRAIVCNKAKTEFSRYYALPAGSLIYKNFDTWEDAYKRNAISVASGEYWPGGTDALSVGRLEYGANGEKYPIGVSIITPTIGRLGSGSDIECEGGVLTLISFNGSTADTRQNLDSSEIILKNNEAGPVIIRKFELRGTPLREVTKVKVEHIDAGVANEWEEREVTLPGTYATDTASAQVIVKRWVDFGKSARKEYEATVDFTPHLQCGALVRFNPLGDLDLVCQVEGYKHSSKGPHGNTRTTVNLVERIDFSAVGSGEVVSVTPPPPPPPTPIPESAGLQPIGHIDGAGQPIPSTWELFDFSNPSAITSFGRRPEPTPYFYHEPARIGIKGNPAVLWSAGKTALTEVTSDMIDRGDCESIDVEMFDRGDCESADSPMIRQEYTPVALNATWVRDAAQKHAGVYSRKFTKTIAAGTGGSIDLTDVVSATEMHGFLGGDVLTFSAWIYIPAGGILGTEITLEIFDNVAGWVSTLQAAANVYDSWQQVTVSRTIRATATGVVIRIQAVAAASINENFYVDDISLLAFAAPMVAGERVPLLSNAIWARSNVQAHAGTYSRKFTKTIAAGTAGYAYQTDNTNTTDLHGFSPGQRVTKKAWVYIPSASGILGTEVVLVIDDYQGGAWAGTIVAAANIYDAWQLVTCERTLRGSISGAVSYVAAAASASINEYFYVDDLSEIVYSVAALIDDTPDASWRGCAGFFRTSRNTIATRDLNDATKWYINAAYHASYGNVWNEDLEQTVWRWKRGTTTTQTLIYDDNQDPGGAGTYALSILIKSEEDVWVGSAFGAANYTSRQWQKVAAGIWTRVEIVITISDPTVLGWLIQKDPGGHGRLDNTKYFYACNPQVEFQPFSSPFIPGNADRPAASLWYRYIWPTQFSVMMWVRPRFGFDAAYDKYLLSDYNGVGGANRIVLKYDATNDKFNALLGDGAAWNEKRTTTAYSATKPTGTGWKHIVASFDRTGKVVKLWEDGVEQATAVAGGPGTITPDSTLSIGGIPLYTSPAGYEADSWIAEMVIMPELVAQATIDEIYAAGRPYYQPDELSNGDMSIRSSPSGLVLTGNSGLCLTDKLGRRIDIAPSSGLLVRDAAGNRIHDTPDAVILADAFVMGHFYRFKFNNADYTLLNTNALGGFSSWLGPLTAVTAGMTNVKGVKLKIYVTTDGAATATPNMQVALRPNGYTSWLGTVNDMSDMDFVGNGFVGAYQTRWNRVVELSVPVDALYKFQYWFEFNPRSIGYTCIIQQIGVWV